MSGTSKGRSTKPFAIEQRLLQNSIRSSPLPPTIIVPFVILFAVRLLAALYSPIQDCDEVFNFWEPTHYLNHGYGMQTWELSPEYSIRSWLYISLHALPVHFASWLPFNTSKTFEFYSLRIFLAVVCACCETRVFSAISRALNLRIAILWVIIAASSAGSFHSTTAYLSSSFAMYSVLLAMADFTDQESGSRIAQGLTWLGIGTILGWPFVAVLCVPFVLEEIAQTGLDMVEVGEMSVRLLQGLGQSLVVLAIEIVVDSAFIRKLTCVPLNIVLYNVFSSSSKGPDIYGTEPWHFYVRNLLINFHLWFILALFAWPLACFRLPVYRGQKKAGLAFSWGVILTSPFYLWLAIFTIQPHKEERFMYPVYPFLAFNAAFSLHQLLVLCTSRRSHTGGRMSSPLATIYIALFALVVFLSAAAALGIWRSVGLATAYSAPLSIYKPLFNNGSVTDPSSSASSQLHNLCLGKEWYRFPSSYHLPQNFRLKLIKSEFSGLLPGEFHESSTTTSAPSTPDNIFPGTHIVPSGMNDENIEDPGKHTSIEECDYLVDSSFPSLPPTQLEPDFVHDAEHWEQVLCEPFLDAAATGLLGRLVWVPDWIVVPERLRRRWGEYCLLRRRK